mmetsp:Transcript_50190/g.98222  ORF Transcript_50190/g.98222 Transcript_50190/m.98222 type:complete len:222 (-) Transcript_50190:457-1122(-)
MRYARRTSGWHCVIIRIRISAGRRRRGRPFSASRRRMPRCSILSATGALLGTGAGPPRPRTAATAAAAAATATAATRNGRGRRPGIFFEIRSGWNLTRPRWPEPQPPLSLRRNSCGSALPSPRCWSRRHPCVRPSGLRPSGSHPTISPYDARPGGWRRTSVPYAPRWSASHRPRRASVGRRSGTKTRSVRTTATSPAPHKEWSTDVEARSGLCCRLVYAWP